MEEILRFSRSVDSITNNEFMQWMNHYDKHFLSKLILNGLFYELEHSKNLNEWNQKYAPKVHKMNENMADIIRNRIEKKENKCNDYENEEEEIKGITLNELPKEMISNICSFLTLSELLKFEGCNKSIFIGTRSPITVYKMSQHHIKKCVRFQSTHSYQFYRFKNLKQIHFEDSSIFDRNYLNLDRYFEIIKTLPFKQLTPNWKNVESLTFTGYFDDMLSIQYVVDNMGHQFMPYLQEFNWIDIREISLEQIDGFKFEMFLEAMNKIKNICNINYFDIKLKALLIKGTVVELNDFINIKSKTMTPIQIINVVNNSNLYQFADSTSICLDFYNGGDEWDGNWNVGGDENKCIQFLSSMECLNYIKIMIDIEWHIPECSSWTIYGFCYLQQQNNKKITLNVNDKFIITM